MAQSYLLASKSRPLPVDAVSRMSEKQAYDWFVRERWHETGGEPCCPHCGVLDPWKIRRRRFKCRAKECRREFSVTTGTAFANHKLSFRKLLVLMAASLADAPGRAALAVTRTLGVQHKTAWTNLMKVREALWNDMGQVRLAGIVEIDGKYLGGKLRPANRRVNQRDGRLAENQNGKQRCVVAVRQRNGRIITFVGNERAEFIGQISRAYVARTAAVRTDGALVYAPLQARHADVRWVDHDVEYRTEDGMHTNTVESFFSRVEHAKDIHRHIAGPYLAWYAADIAWREDACQIDNKLGLRTRLRSALNNPVSRNLCGYWQGRRPTEAVIVGAQNLRMEMAMLV